MRCWYIPTNFGCTDTKTDDEGRELFDGAVPDFVERGTRFVKSTGSISITKVKRVNELKGVQNVDMISGGCSSGGYSRICLKCLQDSGEHLERIGQNIRANGGNHISTTLTTFEEKVSVINGQRRLADRELTKNIYTEGGDCCDTIA